MKLGMTHLRQDFAVKKTENQKQKLGFGAQIPPIAETVICNLSGGDPYRAINLRHHTLGDVEAREAFFAAPTIPQKAMVLGNWAKKQFGNDDDDDFGSGGGGGKDDRLRQIGLAPLTVPVRKN